MHFLGDFDLQSSPKLYLDHRHLRGVLRVLFGDSTTLQSVSLSLCSEEGGRVRWISGGRRLLHCLEGGCEVPMDGRRTYIKHQELDEALVLHQPEH